MANYYGPDEEWAKPAEPSVLGQMWRNSDIYKSFNQYGQPSPPLPNDYARPGIRRDPAKGDVLSYLNGLPSQPNVTPASGNAYTPQQMASSVPPDRLPDMALAGQRYGLSQQGYNPMGQETDMMRRISGGTTTYQQPGVTGLGGIGPGMATFQGTPGSHGANLFGLMPNPQGGSLGYIGTPETANMTQRQATDYNVANLNRQTEALRSLNEARQAAMNPGSATLGGGQSGYNRAFGDLVSIGRAGESFGDEAMRAENARYAIQHALSSPNLSLRQRQTMIDGGQALAGLPTQPSVNRLPASGLSALDPYKMAQLGLEGRKIAGDQANHADRLALDRQRYGLEQQQWQAENARHQSLADSLISQRNAEMQKPMGLEQMKAAMTGQLFQTWQDSMNPNATPDQRAQAAEILKQRQQFFNPYLGVQPTFGG
ncbi:MAG: hypothetical protein ABTR07_17550 [Candidatus Competibacter denitrificans]